MEKVSIGVDVGGTNTALGAVDPEGNVIIRDNIPTPRHGDIDQYIFDLADAIKKMISSLIQKNKDIEILGIGIGAPNGNYYNGTQTDVYIACFNSSGILDNSFGNGGMVTTSITNQDEIVNAMTIQSDGKVVLAGSSFTGNNYDFMMLRYNYNTCATSIINDFNDDINDEIQVFQDDMNLNIVLANCSFENGQAFIYDLSGRLLSEYELESIPVNTLSIDRNIACIIVILEIDNTYYTKKLIIH